MSQRPVRLTLPPLLAGVALAFPAGCGRATDIRPGDIRTYTAARPAAGTPPVGTKVKLGRIVFGAQPGNVVPNQLYRVYAVTRSNDPFRPLVQSKVEGVGAP